MSTGNQLPLRVYCFTNQRLVRRRRSRTRWRFSKKFCKRVIGAQLFEFLISVHYYVIPVIADLAGPDSEPYTSLNARLARASSDCVASLPNSSFTAISLTE